MSTRGWLLVGAFVALLFGLLWIASSVGVFATPEDLNRNAASLDGGALEDWPFDDTNLDASISDAGEDDASPSLALSGRGVVGLYNFSLNDHQGRNVLKVQSLRGSMDLGALRHGVYRIKAAKANGVEVTLYRDESGKLSLADALRDTPDPVKSGLDAPPAGDSKEGAWLIEIGPMRVEDATLTIAFTEKPVQIQVRSAVVTVLRRPGDSAPHIYLERVEGEILKPKPLPHPVRIAFAEGVVRLEGTPMVDLTARTCIGRDELRVHAIVPARKEPVDLTVDSAGLEGALGRLGLKIASRRDHDKLHYQHGPVKLEGGPGCSRHDATKKEGRR